MKKRKITLLTIAVMLMCVLLAMPVSAAPKISKKKATLTVGQTLQLKVKGTKKKVKWSSNKKSVATVSVKGKVKAKKAGKATITAKVGKKKYSCEIAVFVPELSESKLDLNIGECKKLSVSGVQDSIFWSSSNRHIANVTPEGIVIAKGCGSCQIYAEFGDDKLSCTINVGVEDPECFPNKTLKLDDVTINSFEATFVSYEIYRDYSKNIQSVTPYYFPYKYHINISGSVDKPNQIITLRFAFMKDGSFPDMPGNNFIQTKSDSNGNFAINQDINFSTYGEMIYIVQAITWE